MTPQSSEALVRGEARPYDEPRGSTRLLGKNEGPFQGEAKAMNKRERWMRGISKLEQAAKLPFHVYEQGTFRAVVIQGCPADDSLRRMKIPHVETLLLKPPDWLNSTDFNWDLGLLREAESPDPSPHESSSGPDPRDTMRDEQVEAMRFKR